MHLWFLLRKSWPGWSLCCHGRDEGDRCSQRLKLISFIESRIWVLADKKGADTRSLFYSTCRFTIHSAMAQWYFFSCCHSFRTENCMLYCIPLEYFWARFTEMVGSFAGALLAHLEPVTKCALWGAASEHVIFAFLGICFVSVILYPDSVSWDPSAVLQGQFKIWLGLSAVFATVILAVFSTSSENSRVCLVVTSKLFQDWVWLFFFPNKASSYSILCHNRTWNMSFLALPLHSVANQTSPDYWHFKGNPGSVPLFFTEVQEAD